MNDKEKLEAIKKLVRGERVVYREGVGRLFKDLEKALQEIDKIIEE